MKMLILTNKQKKELEELNENNYHLHRALSPVKLSSKQWGLGADILEDTVTWGGWMDFLEDLPQKEVD